VLRPVGRAIEILWEVSERETGIKLDPSAAATADQAPAAA